MARNTETIRRRTVFNTGSIVKFEHGIEPGKTTIIIEQGGAIFEIVYTDTLGGLGIFAKEQAVIAYEALRNADIIVRRS